MPATASTAAKLTATPAANGRKAPATMTATSTRNAMARTKKSCSPLGSAGAGWRFGFADMSSCSAGAAPRPSEGLRGRAAGFPQTSRGRIPMADRARGQMLVRMHLASAAGPSPERLRVVVAGGGVAGLETLVALNALAGDRIAATLVAPESHFALRALDVFEPFGIGRPA